MVAINAKNSTDDSGIAEFLAPVIRALSAVSAQADIMRILCSAARAVTNADGATIVLRTGDHCYYAEENAIAPLWKGRSFPLTGCISGWVMMHGQCAAIEDVYADSRVRADDYRSTFVRSVAMMPIRKENPIGAIGNYWADRHEISEEEHARLEALAALAAQMLDNMSSAF